MDNKPRPAPLSADSLRDNILKVFPMFEEELQYGLLVEITKDKMDRIMELIAAALQSERQRIADSLPENPTDAEYRDNAQYSIGRYETLQAVRALLELPEESRLTSKGEQAQ